ncbi:efflux RND transporter periplasmic adaptor subunit [Aneurinibacillus tyrosinisolvens]|uniref:efflux RND transporter periplasmic adaptor subunit n=1 Tax=Aneurinibacillus tyrosinisolvens TaxID=1443435 RepID=UPI00063FB9FD|nr:efflux RND transporter periplasmic adaptor subunit [Aneurinibacillus tyrosinisolvens]
MRKIVMGMTIAGLVVSSVLAAGCGAGGSKEAAAPAAIKTISVETASAVTGSLDKGRALAGTTQALQLVNVVPKTSARVTSINVKVGQEVSAGDVLFRLDGQDLRHAVEQAQQSLALSRATLAQAQSQQQSGVDSAQGGINQANSGLIQANTALNQAVNGLATAANGLEQANNGLDRAQQAYNDAKTNADRMQMLFDQGAASKQQLEQAQTQLTNAQIAIRDAQVGKKNAAAALKNAETAKGSAEATKKNAAASLQTAQKQVSNARKGDGIEVSRQQVKQAEVALKIARDNLANATVVAPISGMIGTINGEIGDFASPQSPFMVLANLNPMKVIVNTPENLVHLFAMGQTVDVQVPSTGMTTNGTVASISPLNLQSKGYPITIEVPNAGGELKAGMVIQVNVASPGAKRGIVIPTAAVLSEDGKPYVFIAQGDKPVRKPITIVEENSDRAIVTGLSAGQKVITKGQSLLNGDVKISIKK